MSIRVPQFENTAPREPNGSMYSAGYADYELGNPDLPIAAHRTEIEDAIAHNQVVVVEGQTGSGKSTQLAQYAFDTGFRSITNTQPRIAAARSISERISEEIVAVRGERSAAITGYRTAEYGNTTSDTKITIATDGLALQWVLFNRLLERKDHLLILDEAHEMGKNQELLLAASHIAMRQNPHFRAVISSATMDSEALAYFFADSHGKPAPIIRVPGRMYPVETYESGGFVDAIVERLDKQRNTLAFVPGKPEVEATLAEVSRRMNRPVRLLAAHGEQSLAEQSRIFRHYDVPKLVVATDIAKTSLTIDDMDAVVDSGWSRLGHAMHGTDTLDIVPAPWATRDQRKGRVGRTKPGTYTVAQLEGYPALPPPEKMAQYDKPEIQMTRLEDHVLRLRQAGVNPHTLVYFNRPEKAQLDRAELQLQRIGALAVDGSITELGEEMGYLSLDPSLARMVIEARQYGNAVSLQVAALAAVRQNSGITRTLDINEPRWRDLTRERDSDALAQLDVFIAALGMSEAELSRHDIVDRKFYKACMKFEDICESEGLQMHHITKPTESQRKKILLSMLPGAEGVFIRTRSGNYVDANRGRRSPREDSVIRKGAKLLIGQSFNLVTTGYKTFNTKQMINGATEIPTDSLLLRYAPDRCEFRQTGFSFDYHSGTIIAKAQLYFDDMWLDRYKKEPAKPSDELNQFLVRALLTHERLPLGEYPMRRRIYPTIRKLHELQSRTREELGVESFIDDIVQEVAALLPHHMTELTEVDRYLPLLGIDHIIPESVVREIEAISPDFVHMHDERVTVTYRNGKAILHVPIEQWGLLPEAFPELGERPIQIAHTANAHPIDLNQVREQTRNARRGNKIQDSSVTTWNPAQLSRRTLRAIRSQIQPRHGYGS